MSPLRAALTIANRGRAPSPSFLAVLTALAELDEGGYAAQIERRTGTEHRNCRRLLHRMVELGVAYSWDGERGELGGAPRVYYALTATGRELAEQITAGVAR
jgi:DNA-binding PadR family transcriptional regulator